MYSKSLRIGPFTAEINTDIASVASMLERMYTDFPACPQGSFVDFPIIIKAAEGFRRWFYPQAEFILESAKPFKPLPRRQAYPMLEWGLNWCIANHAHQYLIVHASVMEKNGKAIIFPAQQGSGKSTLAAGLMHRGWRLFSDELALIDMNTLQVHKCTRPINLKNDAIDVIAKDSANTCYSDIAHDTRKGTVALLKPSKASIAGDSQALLSAIAFVQYQSGALTSITPVSKRYTFSKLIDNSFNYSVQMQQGFEVVYSIANTVKAYDFCYSDFDDAEQKLTELLCQS